MNKHTLLGAIAAIIGVGTLAACGASSDEHPVAVQPPVTSPADENPMTPEVTTADDEVAMLDMIWPTQGPIVCEAYDQVPATLRGSDEMDDYLVDQFEGGYGSELSDAAAEHLVDLVHDC